ncbi:hypothetical protein C826_00126 [Helicobacter bilis WiWa]|uniref:Uncharacterized protein n=1 Tax=Helicobacter bilis WiWa TaxID=1235804 RepID=N2BLM7_9HELI|nr:hypothetical protein C826_00126 [Helicobacter bilis WiWa]
MKQPLKKDIESKSKDLSQNDNTKSSQSQD